jgi:hypothetical protein
VIDKITKVDCLAKIWRKFRELARDALRNVLGPFGKILKTVLNFDKSNGTHTPTFLDP